MKDLEKYISKRRASLKYPKIKTFENYPLYGSTSSIVYVVSVRQVYTSQLQPVTALLEYIDICTWKVVMEQHITMQ